MAQEQSTEPGEGPARIRVLLVEDNLDHARMVQYALKEDDGFEVVHARTGTRALEEMGAQAFDVCLVDYRLPDYEGVNLCAKMRETFDGPMLLITSLARESAVERAFAHGVDDYLVKDTSMLDRLADEVLRHLRGRA